MNLANIMIVMLLIKGVNLSSVIRVRFIDHQELRIARNLSLIIYLLY